MANAVSILSISSITTVSQYPNRAAVALGMPRGAPSRTTSPIITIVCGAANPGCSRLSAGCLYLASRRFLPQETLPSGISFFARDGRPKSRSAESKSYGEFPEKGVVKPRKPPVARPRPSQARRVPAYLLRKRGLSPFTLRNYVPVPVVEQLLSSGSRTRLQPSPCYAPRLAPLRRAPK
jgi:hypothetical protein